MQPESEDNDEAQKESHFQNYADYSRTLRAWFVAYGIGGPVLFLTNDTISGKISASLYANCIIYSFMAGVGLQIFLAIINKWCAWHMYRGAGDDDYQNTMRYRLWCGINACSWIDFWIDMLSLVAFVYATGKVMKLFLTNISA